CSTTQAEGVGTPACPARIVSMPVPCSSASACSQYRLSVQRPANDWLSTKVPAEPLNPDSHSRACQRCGRYSDKCGSDVGTTQASMPRSRMTRRRASKRRTITDDIDQAATAETSSLAAVLATTS